MNQQNFESALIDLTWKYYNEREMYWRDWNGRAANRVADLEAEIKALKEYADLWNRYGIRLLVLATKYCPKDHHDWDEVMNIAEAAAERA